VASATEERTLEGNPKEASSRELQPSRLSEPGKKALKRAHEGALERAFAANPHEGRDRETGTHPAGG